MNIQPECFSCLLRRSLYETRLVDESLGYEVMRVAAKVLLQEFNETANSAKVATKVHKEVYKLLGEKDPYKGIKARSNKVAMDLLGRAEEFIAGSRDKLKASVICSIAANVLDFGIAGKIGGPEELKEIFDALLEEGLGHDDTPKIKKLLKASRKVMVFGDNAGEIVMDKLLVRELKKFDVHLTYVVRGQPILTDATTEDAEEIGLDKIADEIETTNAFAVGVDLSKLTREMKNKVENADLLICKGMANWESFSDEFFRPIAYFLRAKCRPVAESLGVPVDVSVAKLFE